MNPGFFIFLISLIIDARHFIKKAPQVRSLLLSKSKVTRWVLQPGSLHLPRLHIFQNF